jgi:hypothetical protein
MTLQSTATGHKSQAIHGLKIQENVLTFEMQVVHENKPINAVESKEILKKAGA